MKKDKKSKYNTNNIEMALAFNKQKTIVTITMTNDSPITEAEFIHELADFIRIFGEGFDFAELGEMIDFDMFLDEDEAPPDGVYH